MYNINCEIASAAVRVSSEKRRKAVCIKPRVSGQSHPFLCCGLLYVIMLRLSVMCVRGKKDVERCIHQ